MPSVTPYKIAKRERAARALELRKTGATYDTIARELGYSNKVGAYKAVQNGLRLVGREAAEDLLDLELARLDEMQLALHDRVCAGDDDAIRTALSIMNRRARYLGLDDYEKRMADVAETQSFAINLQVSWLYQSLNRILNQLDLTPEQQERAPLIIAGELAAENGEPLALGEAGT